MTRIRAARVTGLVAAIAAALGRPRVIKPIGLAGAILLSACQVTASPGQSVPPSASVRGSPGATCLGIAAGTTGAFSVTIAGQSRRAFEHVPASDEPITSRPVVVMFHGYAASPQEAEAASGLSVKSDSAGFIVVYPEAAGDPPKWDVHGDTDITFVDSILDALAADPCVDSSRIYAAGFSMGGGMTAAVGCRFADRVAAVAPVSGVYGPNWAEPCNPANPVPIVVFHGVLDPQVPYDGGLIDQGENPDLPSVIGVESWASTWAERNGCNATPEAQTPIGKVQGLFWTDCAAPVHLYRITDGGHTWPGSTTNDPMTNRDISATDLMWDFFGQFTLPSG